MAPILLDKPAMRPFSPFLSSRRLKAAAVAAAALLPPHAAAQAPEPLRRTGAERQVVVQLAYALGESHALHRLCAGPADGTWYSRMQQLEAGEAADEASRRQLVESFNAGYAARRAQFPGCSRRSRAAERAVAERGRELADRLAGASERASEAIREP